MDDAWAGVVFDLDGTLVHLDVNWEAAEQAVRTALREHGLHDPEQTVWTLLEASRQAGVLQDIEPVLNEFEIEGAETSKRLPLARAIPDIDRPVAVCSLNCEAACRRALTVHDLDSHIDAVVGRDTVRPWKPDPAPLEEAFSHLGVSPNEGGFIGDSARDRHAAERAGSGFKTVDEALAYVEA